VDLAWAREVARACSPRRAGAVASSTFDGALSPVPACACSPAFVRARGARAARRVFARGRATSGGREGACGGTTRRFTRRRSVRRDHLTISRRARGGDRQLQGRCGVRLLQPGDRRGRLRRRDGRGRREAPGRDRGRVPRGEVPVAAPVRGAGVRAEVCRRALSVARDFGDASVHAAQVCAPRFVAVGRAGLDLPAFIACAAAWRLTVARVASVVRARAPRGRPTGPGPRCRRGGRGGAS
jgi:hypothetical protein